MYIHIVYTHMLHRYKAKGYSPSCTSQRGPVHPSSQKQEPEPPRPSSQCPCWVQRQAGKRDKFSHRPKEMGQGRVDGEKMAYLGTGVQRHLGHRVHRLSQQNPDGNYTVHFRLCHPCTRHGHCRGFWGHQGKLGNSVDMSGTRISHKNTHSCVQLCHLCLTKCQPRLFKEYQSTHVPTPLRPHETQRMPKPFSTPHQT